MVFIYTFRLCCYIGKPTTEKGNFQDSKSIHLWLKMRRLFCMLNNYARKRIISYQMQSLKMPFGLKYCKFNIISWPLSINQQIKK